MWMSIIQSVEDLNRTKDGGENVLLAVVEAGVAGTSIILPLNIEMKHSKTFIIKLRKKSNLTILHLKEIFLFLGVFTF
jgi:hypothetical protein